MKNNQPNPNKTKELKSAASIEIGKTGIKVGLKQPLSFLQLCILLILLAILIACFFLILKNFTWLGLLSWGRKLFQKSG
jgi:hypothetical protein